jgi:hypothetical protein
MTVPCSSVFQPAHSVFLRPKRRNTPPQRFRRALPARRLPHDRTVSRIEAANGPAKAKSCNPDAHNSRPGEWRLWVDGVEKVPDEVMWLSI